MDVTPKHWPEIEEIYHSALLLPPAERAIFLERCGAGEDVVREVEGLLGANDAAGDFLDSHVIASEIQQLQTPSLPGLEHYDVISHLGSGGMGVVYLAKDTRLDRLVAIKMLPATLVPDSFRRSRFEREARAASMLNHPNIITIYEIGSSGGRPYIAAEFVEGETLRQRIASGTLDLPGALRVAIQVARALEAAHAAGIVHRDIKPENVMVRPDGLVKVLDFGIAKVVEEQLKTYAEATGTGRILGTPRYMAPEQARGRELDGRADVFSLAAVIYELAAGAPAFAGTTQAEVFAALLEREPEPLRRIAPQVPEELETTLAKALRKTPEQRQQSMREFADDLERALLYLHTGQKPQRRRFSLRMPPRRWLRPAAIVGAALVGIGGAYLATSRVGVRTVRTIPFASFAGSKDWPAFSPDGSRIAFSWDGGRPGKRGLYVKAGADEPVRLTKPGEDTLAPAWSPDGRTIAYLTSEMKTGPSGEYLDRSLHLIPAAGGQEKRVGYSSAGVSWSPDGKRLAVVTMDYRVAILDLGSGVQSLVTSPQPLSDSFPEFSPDGQAIAFLRSISGVVREVFVMPASGGVPRQVTWMKRPVSRVVWTSDGRELVFSAWGDMWRVGAGGGNPRRLQVDGMSANYPTISRKGDLLAFTETYTDINIWRFMGAGFGGESSPAMMGSAECLLCSTREDHSPSISGDGNRIVFVSKRTGHEEIWTSDRDGAQLRQLTSSDGPVNGMPQWSPDGKWIAYDGRMSGDPAIYVIPAEGGAARKLNTTSGGATTPSWSADGRSIYYNSTVRGRNEVFKSPVAGGTSIQVTHGGGAVRFESPDGKMLYFSRPRSTYGLWTAPVNGGEEKPSPELGRAGYWRTFGSIKQGVYYVTKEDEPRPTIRFFSFATRKITPLATVPTDPPGAVPGLALSPDGKYLLWAQKDLEVNNIKVVEGFR